MSLIYPMPRQILYCRCPCPNDYQRQALTKGLATKTCPKLNLKKLLLKQTTRKNESRLGTRHLYAARISKPTRSEFHHQKLAFKTRHQELQRKTLTKLKWKQYMRLYILDEGLRLLPDEIPHESEGGATRRSGGRSHWAKINKITLAKITYWHHLVRI